MDNLANLALNQLNTVKENIKKVSESNKDNIAYYIFSYCDVHYRLGMFEDVDEYINQLELDKMSDFTISSWLIGLSWAKSKLNNYNKFRAACNKFLKDSGRLDEYRKIWPEHVDNI